MNKKTLLAPILIGIIALSGCAESAATTTESSSDMFTERDLRVEYEVDDSIAITLNGDTATCDSSAVEIEESTITITDEGVYIVTGTLDDGMIIVDAENTDKVQIVLDGVNISCDDSAAIYIAQAKKVFITTAEGSENTLSNGGNYVAIDNNNIDSVIFSKDDLTLNGQGTLTINAEAGHGVVSKDDLVLTSGTYNITTASHGLSGKNSVRIADGTYTITSGKDAIHSDNTDDEEKGFVYIENGILTLNADDDGVHASNTLTIEGGTIDISKSYEGLEALAITINGGDIDVIASDDGLNAAGGNDSSGDMFAVTEGAKIEINGGTLHVNADGDGLDSNGDLEVNGGTTYVSGSTNSGNGALDYNGNANITGGTFVATGMSGMAQTFSESSQGVIAISASGSEGSTITLTDESGNELGSWTADKSYDCVVISTPDIEKGNTYTVTSDGSSTEVTMSDLIYSSISGGHGGGGNPVGGQGGGPSGNGNHDDSDGGREMPSGDAPSGGPGGDAPSGNSNS